ncbi:MAG: SDR family oxidoreductase [Betaproteobacteria bacterium]|nr:SDR family oxidoreductase [Betaproteobacteria bacterium]
MELQLTGKTALVTGASRGIGRAIALGLAREGVKVAIAARRVTLLEELAREIVSQRGAEPPVIAADLYQEGAAEKLAGDALAALGRIDILVNAAGGSRPFPFEATKEQWAEGMLVNFVRLRELTHAVVPGMMRERWGRIINITGSSEPRGINAANSAKAAVHAWAKGLSREIARHGITINSIQPGRIVTEQILRMHPTEEDRRRFSQENIPAGRFGEPEELANLAVFLCSPRAGYITGSVIPVDGGMSRFAF